MSKFFEQATGLQRRTIIASELRTGTGDEFALVGYAATFNNLSHNLGGFRERIAPGAFGRSLKAGADVRFLLNHAPDNILGRTRSGTLTLSEDEKGLKFRCLLNRASSFSSDVYQAVKRGDISECSFAFTVPQGGDLWESGRDADSGATIQIRTLKDVDLMDCSLATYPAYPSTSADSRAKDKATALLDSHGLKEAVLYLRRAAILMGVQGPELRGDSSKTDFTSRMDVAHRCAELACAISHRCYDEMPDDSDEVGGHDEVLRTWHEGTNEVLNVACEHMAQVRLRHSKLKMAQKVIGRGKK